MLALALVVLGPPTAVLAWATRWIHTADFLEAHGLVADGVVVNAEAGTGLDNGSSYCVERIEFKDVTGTVRRTQRSCDDPAQAGAHVVVHYVTDPDAAVCVEGDSRYGQFMFMLIFRGLSLSWLGLRVLPWGKLETRLFGVR